MFRRLNEVFVTGKSNVERPIRISEQSDFCTEDKIARKLEN